MLWDKVGEIVGLLVIAAGVVASYVKTKTTQEQQAKDHNKLKAVVNQNSEDIDQLKEEKTRTSTMLANVIKMQEETRLDVKQILQNIATLAANQNKSNNNEQ